MSHVARAEKLLKILDQMAEEQVPVQSFSGAQLDRGLLSAITEGEPICDIDGALRALEKAVAPFQSQIDDRKMERRAESAGLLLATEMPSTAELQALRQEGPPRSGTKSARKS